MDAETKRLLAEYLFQQAENERLDEDEWMDWIDRIEDDVWGFFSDVAEGDVESAELRLIRIRTYG
jgi:hypothetical protein